MSSSDTFLAIFLGTKTSPRQKAWDAMPDAERAAKVQTGMAAWNTWMEKHRDALVTTGGPLGKTKRIGPGGVSDVTNEMAAFVVVRAASHEAAAKMFEDHPHFAIFPGDGVDVMPLLPIPGA